MTGAGICLAVSVLLLATRVIYFLLDFTVDQWAQQDAERKRAILAMRAENRPTLPMPYVDDPEAQAEEIVRRQLDYLLTAPGVLWDERSRTAADDMKGGAT